MEYTRIRLEIMSIHNLRHLGKSIGVKSPCTLNKSQLIEQIVLIQKGNIKPCFSKKGRPTKLDTNEYLARKKEEKIEIVKQQIDILEKTLNDEIAKLREILSKQ